MDYIYYPHTTQAKPSVLYCYCTTTACKSGRLEFISYSERCEWQLESRCVRAQTKGWRIELAVALAGPLGESCVNAKLTVFHSRATGVNTVLSRGSSNLQSQNTNRSVWRLSILTTLLLLLLSLSLCPLLSCSTLSLSLSSPLPLCTFTCVCVCDREQYATVS